MKAESLKHADNDQDDYEGVDVDFMDEDDRVADVLDITPKLERSNKLAKSSLARKRYDLLMEDRRLKKMLADEFDS